MREKQESSQIRDSEDTSIIGLNLDFSMTRTSAISSQYQIQDTISFPATTKRKRI